MEHRVVTCSAALRRPARWRALALLCLAPVAYAGPPYLTDDPQPTDYRHFETYLYGSGNANRAGSTAETGVDFNFGARPDLQLTAVAPIDYQRPAAGTGATGLGNFELAAKYRFAHRERCGWDISTFPRWILPSVAREVGARHHAFQLPIWLEKDYGRWSTFGGAGITLQRGAGARDYALVGWAITRQVLPRLQLGAELFHRSADVPGGLATTVLNAGMRYDFSEHYHLLGSSGPGIQNATRTNAHSWYLGLLITR